MEWQLMTAEQKDITGWFVKFLENELAPLVQECDGVSRFLWKYLRKWVRSGFGEWIYQQNTAVQVLTCRHYLFFVKSLAV